MGKSPNPGVARPLMFSPMKGKTPLVLPRTLSGERRKGLVSPTSGNRSSPSQGAVGYPLERDQEGLPAQREGLPTQREGLPTRRGDLCAKKGAVKGSGSAISPAARGQRPGSLFVWMPHFARHRQDASQNSHVRSPRCAEGDDPTADPSNCGSLRTAQGRK